jgi:hypothetical protein
MRLRPRKTIRVLETVPMKSNAIFLSTAAVMVAIAPPVQACSICRCGDPTFNALGKEGVAQTGWRIALDWDQVKKTQGDPADDFDAVRERRTTALVAWGVSDRVGLFARLPWGERDLSETQAGVTTSTRASGLADPEIYAQARLWSSLFEGDVGVRSSLYAVFGVKTPWGENNAKEGGVRLDEHVQPGTGSTDWFVGLSGSYQVTPSSALFASAQYRHTGTNDYDYRYGRVVLLNLAYEHKLTTSLDGVVEVNYRHAGTDRIDAPGTHDGDTGGSIAYFTPRLLFSVGSGWVVRASAQLPLGQSGLNGLQHEKAVLNLGVTKMFRLGQ